MQRWVTLRTDEFQSALNLYYILTVWIHIDDYAQVEYSINPGLCCFTSLDVIPRCGWLAWPNLAKKNEEHTYIEKALFNRNSYFASGILSGLLRHGHRVFRRKD